MAGSEVAHAGWAVLNVTKTKRGAFPRILTAVCVCALVCVCVFGREFGENKGTRKSEGTRMRDRLQ